MTIVKEKFPKLPSGYNDMNEVVRVVTNSEKTNLSIFFKFLSLEAEKTSEKDKNNEKIKVGSLLEIVSCSFWATEQALSKIDFPEKASYAHEENLAKSLFSLSYKSVITFLLLLEKRLEKIYIDRYNTDQISEATCFSVAINFIHQSTMEMQKVWKICEEHTEEI